MEKTNIQKLRAKCNRIKSANPINVLNLTIEALLKDVDAYLNKGIWITKKEIKQLLKGEKYCKSCFREERNCICEKNENKKNHNAAPMQEM